MSKYDDKFLYSVGLVPSFWHRYVVPGVKEIKGNKCEQCGSKENLEVHHSSYEVQTIDTLLLLCKSCHKKWHHANKAGSIMVDEMLNKISQEVKQ